jgi:glutamyl-tRNA synthetase
VIRGDDHVNNTPRQILLYQALGYEVPLFAHVPMILGPDKARLSKRHGATSVMAYRDMGFLPEALVNYLVRLGWAHGDQEIFTGEELTGLFSLEAVGKSAAVFNPDKLLWLNQHYIKNCPTDRLAEEMRPFWRGMGLDAPDTDFARGIVISLKERAKTLIELAEGSLFYFADVPGYEEEATRKFLTPEASGYLEAIAEALPSLADYSKAGIENFLRSLAEERGTKLKFIAQPLRVALTGKTVSPGIDDVMAILGKERVLERLRHAVNFIGKQALPAADSP